MFGVQRRIESLKPDYSQFNFTLPTIYYAEIPAEPAVVAKLQLPSGYHIDVRRVKIDQPIKADFGVDYATNVGYDLVLDPAASIHVQMTGKVNDLVAKVNGQRKTVLCRLSDSPTTVTPGDPFIFICISAREKETALIRATVNVEINGDVKPIERTAEAEKHFNQISSLLSSLKFADCKVISSDGEEFDCHKAILSVKSVVIQTAFEAEYTSEAKSGKITLDCTSDIVKLLLSHFYTGEMPVVPNQILTELYSVAHLYQIDSLKTLLAAEMGLRAKCPRPDQLLSIQNVIEFVVFADKFDLDALRHACLKFIFTNRMKVVKQPEWKEFYAANPHLVEEMLLV